MVTDKTEVKIRDMLINYDSAKMALEHQLYFNRDDPDIIKHRLEEYEDLYNAVQELHERQRIAISVLYFPRTTYLEAAEIIGCDRTTVYRNVTAGIKSLARRLKKRIEKPDKT